MQAAVRPLRSTRKLGVGCGPHYEGYACRWLVTVIRPRMHRAVLNDHITSIQPNFLTIGVLNPCRPRGYANDIDGVAGVHILVTPRCRSVRPPFPRATRVRWNTEERDPATSER